MDGVANMSISAEDIERARRTLADAVWQTPVLASPTLSERAGTDVVLKCEHLQATGSFKVRGATNAVRNLTEDQRRNGVVGVSTGNHGRGLAHAARQAGIKCIICMSRLAPQAKIDGIEALGAEVRITGASQDEAQHEVDRLVAEDGMTMLPPFDNIHVIAGQGTLGLELLDQVPDIGTAIIAVSGGGLISGVATALKSHRPGIKVIGVSMERGAAMYASQMAGQPVEVEELSTLADALGGGIGLDNRYTFGIVRDLVDEFVLVSEAEIAAAMRHCYWAERQIVEGSGAVGVAAILGGHVEPKGKTVILLCGGNVDMAQHHRIVSGEDVDVMAEV